MRILIFLLIFLSGSVGLGAPINEKEYPGSQHVLPNTDFVIHGGVEQNIDMTLERCLKLALGNNPEINAAFQEILASDTRIKQVWANYFPGVSWTSSYQKIRQLQFLAADIKDTPTFNYWLTGQISLQQMLYDFGVTQNQATIRRLEYETARSALAETINTIIFQTKDAYYNLLFAFEQRQVAKENVERFEQFYDRAKASYEVGLTPKVDVTIAQVNLSNAKLELIRANNAVNIAVARLNNVMGVPFIDEYNVAERLYYQPVNMDFNGCVVAAREARPELKAAELRVERTRQVVQLAKKSYFPNLSFQGMYQYGGSTPTTTYGFNFGGYLTFPMINGMLIKNEIREAQHLYDKELAGATITQNTIYLEIQEAWLMLEEKKHQLPLAILGVKQAKENYELSFGRYSVGEGNPIELKDSQINYQQAQLQYYRALYEYNSSRAGLEKAVGKNIVNHEDVIDFEG